MKISRFSIALVSLCLGGCATADRIVLALATDQARAQDALALTSVRQEHASKRTHDVQPKPKIAKSPKPLPGVASVAAPILPPWTISAPRPSRILRYSLTPSELFKRLSQSVYTVTTPKTQGSAVAVSSHELVTNCHVVSRGRAITLTNGASTLKAEVAGADPSTDRCFLRVADNELVPVPGLRDYSTLRVGEGVFTIGSPRGLGNTLGAGLLSGLRTGDDKMDYIQITAPLSPGSSGGGLFDDRGNLIGITSFTIRESQNLNFAIAAAQFWQ